MSRPNFCVVLATAILSLIHGTYGLDKCGPSNGPKNASSTCKKVSYPQRGSTSRTWRAVEAPILAKAPPAVYGVTCIEDATGQYLNAGSCDSNAVDLCVQLNQTNTPRGQWLWSTGGPNCTFGAWVPTNLKTSAPIPKYDRCLNDILKPMANWCGISNMGQSNAASVNLMALPSDDGSTGMAVNPDYLSYVLVAQGAENTKT